MLEIKYYEQSGQNNDWFWVDFLTKDQNWAKEHAGFTANGWVSTIGMCIIIITIVGDKIRGSGQPLWRVTSHDVVLLGTKLWTYQRQNVAYLLIKELLGKKWSKARHYCRHFTSIRACSLIFWPILKKCYEVLNAWNAAWHHFEMYLDTWWWPAFTT